jgi:hypothetical protein
MKTAKRQTAQFRKALWAEKAREAYIQAKRGGEFSHLCFDDFDDNVTDIVGLSQPVDFSAYAPFPSSNGWEGLGA